MIQHALDVLDGRRLVVLTGAGISTDSGIPDYRGPRPAGSPPVRMPMTYQEFAASPEGRQRYWARAHVGWSRMTGAEPNDGHRALARTADVDLAVTQNVDGLHERAGQRDLVALHGRISEVVCLDCRTVTGREGVQARMFDANPGYADAHADVATRPDGDVSLEETAGFVVPACEGCGGRLKPHVVFFGENVPKDRVLRVTEAVERSDAVLVVGSSLTVMSGFRFARQAFRQGTPLVIVNRGQTRADDLASVKVEAGCSEFLQELARERGQGRERTQTVGSSPASREAASAESAVSTSVTT